MLKDQTLTYFDPIRAAGIRETIKGSLPLSGFNLPPEVLPNQSAEVKYEIKCGVDQDSFVFLNGKVQTVISLACQRCMKPMEHKIEIEFHLSPIQDSKQERELPERYEAVLMEQNKLSITRLLEDELILNLPIAPLHEGECSPIYDKQVHKQ